jgi:hypothetical protein
MQSRIVAAGAWVAILATCGLALHAASAAPVRDEASGLVVDPPEGYVVVKAAADARYAVVYSVKKADEEDTGCKVAFQAAPQNAPLTQEDINAFSSKPEWANLVKATLALVYEVASVEPFEQAGVAGAAAVADFKPIEDQPRAGEVRSYLVLLDTPKGRTTVVCVGEKAGFEARKPEFEKIARTVSPPR